MRDWESEVTDIEVRRSPDDGSIRWIRVGVVRRQPRDVGRVRLDLVFGVEDGRASLSKITPVGRNAGAVTHVHHLAATLFIAERAVAGVPGVERVEALADTLARRRPAVAADA